MATLAYHDYRYFPYELEFARREAERAAGGSSPAREVEGGLEIDVPASRSGALRKLTYFAEVRHAGQAFTTAQHDLEAAHRAGVGGGRRQATRYGVHGLHEYKGKFNPQTAGFLLSHLGAGPSTPALDPFCGSGTTLVEAAVRGVPALGVDANPLAVFVADAKLAALSIPAEDLAGVARSVATAARRARGRTRVDNPRGAYLDSWFDQGRLDQIERLRAVVPEGPVGRVLLAVAADLLRDHSLQEPSDLRIRRRNKTPMPEESFIDAFATRASAFCATLAAAQEVTGVFHCDAAAEVGDARRLDASVPASTRPGAVVTSPPYATALPYIDTNRLGLVWLGIASPEELRLLENDAVGTREGHRSDMDDRMLEDADGLPRSVVRLCWSLYGDLSSTDGFRRRATPAMLYRYFAHMKAHLRSLAGVCRPSAAAAYVVGTNATTIGGARRTIDTPRLLADIAEDLGHVVAELTPLQAYQRYGIHHRNGVRGESLLVLSLG